jgi:hypothetical protein
MNAKAIMKYFSLMIAVFAISVSVSGCSLLPKGDNSQSKRVLNSKTYESAQPSDFDGPYASDLANAMKTTRTDYVYNILKDSKITDQEFQETQSVLTKCYSDNGLSIKYAKEPFMLGSYVVIVPGADSEGNGGRLSDKRFSISENCEGKTGYLEIATVYYKMQMNPEKKDLSSFSAQCLIKIGFRVEGYNGTDFNKEFEKKFSTSAQPIFGNETTSPSGNLIFDMGDNTTEQEIDNALAGKPSKNVISYIDLNKCLFEPELVLSEK